MQIVLEYISMNYITLMLLAGLIVILVANRRTKIEGVQYAWTITGLVFVLTICEYLEVWCDTYHKPVWILYLKAALSYTIHPLLILLELYLVAPIKRKLLLFLPYLADVILVITDLFGTNLIYGYGDAHNFVGGKLHFFLALILCFYILLLMKYSLGFLHNKEYSKAMIVIFMALSTIITVYLEFDGIIVGHTTEIAALEMLVYYFYLAAIHHSEVQERLHKKELELEKSKQTLLMAQIKPHFINNAMVAVQELCYDDPEKAARLIRHFSRYLRNNIHAIDSEAAIRFEQELDAVREYLAIEYADSSKKFQVEYDLQKTDFWIPPLTVEPLVENAVKHGIDKYSDQSRIVIAAYETETHDCVEVRDNGKGFDVHAETLGKDGIGLQNAISRLKMMCGGDMMIERTDGWTVITIKLPKRRNTDADDHIG